MTGEGIDELARRDRGAFEETLRPVELLVPYAEGGSLSELYELGGEVEREEQADGVLVRARIPSAIAHRFERFSVNGSNGSPRRRWRLPAVGRIRFRLLSEAARLPTRAHPGDAGLDLYASEAATIEPGGRAASAPASRSRSRPATPGWSCRDRASPHGTGSP